MQSWLMVLCMLRLGGDISLPFIIISINSSTLLNSFNILNNIKKRLKAKKKRNIFFQRSSQVLLEMIFCIVRMKIILTRFSKISGMNLIPWHACTSAPKSLAFMSINL